MEQAPIKEKCKICEQDQVLIWVNDLKIKRPFRRRLEKQGIYQVCNDCGKELERVVN